MIAGLYTAAGGMLSVEARQEAIANNIANAATPGYKRHLPVQLGFYQMFLGEGASSARFRVEAAPSGGVKLVETSPDLRDGTMQQTDNALNFALQGPGFFVVDTPNGERYTRSGNFTIDEDGDLADTHGFKLQSAGGAPIPAGDGLLVMGEDGAFSINGAPAGQLRLVEFETPERLMRDGDSLYRASEEVSERRAEASDTRIVQGSVEMSNVRVPEEMVQMMLGARAYEANQRMIQTVDATLGRLIDTVAMPS